MAIFRVIDPSNSGYDMESLSRYGAGQAGSTISATSSAFTFHHQGAGAAATRYMSSAHDITYSGVPGSQTPAGGTFDRIDILDAGMNTGASLTGFGTLSIGAHFSGDTSLYSLLAGADLIIGGNGDDILFGGDGADVIIGGGGNDNFWFSSYLNNAGSAIGGGSGTDALAAWGHVDFTGMNLNSIERVNLLSNDGSGATGGAAFLANQVGAGLALNTQVYSVNVSDQLSFEMYDRAVLNLSGFTFTGWGPNDQVWIIGDASDESITGSVQSDWILAGAGADTLNGLDGNDILNGGTGADVMRGNLGNDTYFIDVAGDTIVELAGQGSDKVVSATLSLNLATLAGGQIESAELTGAAALNLTGNTVGNLLLGNAAANTISAGAGNDVVNGKLGNDLLVGGSGLDTFVFNTQLNGATNRDTIQDFSSIDDTIRLENTGTGLFNNLANGVLTAAAFWSAAGATTGHDASDRIIYNSATGDLYYDADGNGAGAAIRFATLSGHPALSNADFFVV